MKHFNDYNLNKVDIAMLIFVFSFLILGILGVFS